MLSIKFNSFFIEKVNIKKKHESNYELKCEN